jgi:hypothetical protein
VAGGVLLGMEQIGLRNPQTREALINSIHATILS